MAAVKKANSGGSKKLLKLDKIRLDGDTQSRKEIDEDVVKEYAGLMKDGVEFPPLLVVFDGASYWLVDGFHRRWAAVEAKLGKLKCIVKPGTREDARWLSYGCNKDHGLPRTITDKQKAVVAALKHPKGSGKSDRQIADHVGVSPNMVKKHRGELESTAQIAQSSERIGKDGRTINTANIGQSQKAEALARAASNGTRGSASAGETHDPPAASEETGAADSDDDPNEHCRTQIENERATGDINTPPGPDWTGLLRCIAECRRAADTTNVRMGRKGKFCEEFQETCGILDDIVREWRKVK